MWLPGFPGRGTNRGHRVRLSSRKAACCSVAPTSSTGNPGSVYTNCETANPFHQPNRRGIAMATATLIEQQEQTLKDEAEIRAVIERLHQAHYDKDVQAIAAAYAQ